MTSPFNENASMLGGPNTKFVAPDASTARAWNDGIEREEQGRFDSFDFNMAVGVSTESVPPNGALRLTRGARACNYTHGWFPASPNEAVAGRGAVARTAGVFGADPTRRLWNRAGDPAAAGEDDGVGAIIAGGKDTAKEKAASQEAAGFAVAPTPGDMSVRTPDVFFLPRAEFGGTHRQQLPSSRAFRRLYSAFKRPDLPDNSLAYPITDQDASARLDYAATPCGALDSSV